MFSSFCLMVVVIPICPPIIASQWTGAITNETGDFIGLEKSGTGSKLGTVLTSACYCQVNKDAMSRQI